MALGVQVFVANLPWKASEDEVRKHFEDAGYGVKDIRLRVENGKSKGWGFVTFADPRANAEQIIAKMHGTILGTRPLTVQAATGAKRKSA